MPRPKKARVEQEDLGYGNKSPWSTGRQAKWTMPDIRESIRMHCSYCNQVDAWTEGNDCISSGCPLFPYRPGSQRVEVNGVRRAVKVSRGGGRGFQTLK